MEHSPIKSQRKLVWAILVPVVLVLLGCLLVLNPKKGTSVLRIVSLKVDDRGVLTVETENGVSRGFYTTGVLQFPNGEQMEFCSNSGDEISVGPRQWSKKVSYWSIVPAESNPGRDLRDLVRIEEGATYQLSEDAPLLLFETDGRRGTIEVRRQKSLLF